MQRIPIDNENDILRLELELEVGISAPNTKEEKIRA